LFERHTGRLQLQLILTGADILSETAPMTAEVSEHCITWLKPQDLLADSFNAPCHVRAQYLLHRTEKSEHKAVHERSAVERLPVPIIQGRGMNPYQNLIVSGSGLFHLSQFKDIRRSVSCENDRFH
jgi:hypothetical protein